jgi:hypothetical protein
MSSARCMARRTVLAERQLSDIKHLQCKTKKQGAAGITSAAPYVTGQWGRGDNRLPE